MAESYDVCSSGIRIKTCITFTAGQNTERLWIGSLRQCSAGLRCSSSMSIPASAHATTGEQLKLEKQGPKTAYTKTGPRTSFQFSTAIKRCRDLKTGRELHQNAVAAGFEADKHIAAALITMYAKCRSMPLAKQVFDRMVHRDVVSWTNLMLGYAENGKSLLALDLFGSMDCEPDTFAYVAALKACVRLVGSEKKQQLGLMKAIEIHKQAADRGLNSNIFVGSTLVDLYSKSGRMDYAREVFDSMSSKNAVTWTSLILGYIQNGQNLEAIDLVASMDCAADSLTYVAALKACTSLSIENESHKQLALQKGIAIHKQLKAFGFGSSVSVANTLVNMYSKCGSMDAAREVFDHMVLKDIVSWNSLIIGYVLNGHNLVAMDLFSRMDLEPDARTYVAALKACGSLAGEKGLENKRAWFLQGVALHQRVKVLGLDTNMFVANTLLFMYSKFGAINLARDAFDKMVVKNAVSWNNIILGYVENGQSSTAIDLFTVMDCEPTLLTYAAALKACGSLASEDDSEKEFCLRKGVEIHNQVKERGFGSNLPLGNALIAMYSKCGSMEQAREVFQSMVSKDVVTWTSLILGYVQNGQSSVALDLFARMDCEADFLAYIAALKACGSLACEDESQKQACLEKGLLIHEQIKDGGYISNQKVAACLIDMYCKCGNMERAREVFDILRPEEVVTWTSIIAGYVQNGQSSVAMDLFTRMQCEPDSFAYVAVLTACGSLSNLPAGRQIHARICELGLEQDQVVANALMDFYVKCGNLKRAEELFSNVPSPNIIAWNALITGYSSTGDSCQVFSIAKQIREAGLRMDGIAFLGLLTACSHAGLLDEGRFCFDSMTRCGLSPALEHFNCMIDMLSRANRLQEALDLVKTMPFEANSMSWMILLGGCRRWKNLEIGKIAFNALVALNTTDSAPYVLMSDIYRSLNLFDQMDTELQSPPLL